MNKITKAIIPVAGWGTRRLPITKTIEKCMLPVGNRPIIDYVVEDCIKAGITDIYFVVSEGSTQVKSFYSNNPKLEEYLKANGKEKYLELVTPPAGINFHFIEQDPNGKYGTAIPVYLVAQEIGDESVLVLMGDDFIYNRDGSSDVARLVEQAGEGSALLGAQVAPDEVSRYGVIELDAEHNFKQIVEKPEPEDAPSNLINISKYVLSAQAVAMIKAYAERDDIQGEYYITVPLNDYVSSGQTLKVVPAEGVYLDGGTVEGWVHANRVVVEGYNG
jgi:hypothetical protein